MVVVSVVGTVVVVVSVVGTVVVVVSDAVVVEVVSVVGTVDVVVASVVVVVAVRKMPMSHDGSSSPGSNVVMITAGCCLAPHPTRNWRSWCNTFQAHR